MITLLTLVSIIYVFNGIEDCIIDYLYLKYGKIKSIDNKFLHKLMTIREKKIAIIIPAWKESEVIFEMVSENIKKIDYKNFVIFIGVYPNDEDTFLEATKLTSKFPNVKIIHNSRFGPTTKAQMVNLMISDLKHNHSFDAVQFHDAEDVVHPLLLKVVNERLNKFDFIQTPVFSINDSSTSLVGGTYADEFCESHIKEMDVRSRATRIIPSAGVGTTISKSIFTKEDFQLNENSLTEDYELGISCGLKNYKTDFTVIKHPKILRESTHKIVGTYEYFPDGIQEAIKQKTRWNIGNALQGWKNLGWSSNLVHNYFLYRDRKSLMTSPFIILGYLLSLHQIWNLYFFEIQIDFFLKSLLFFNGGLLAFRFLRKCYFNYLVYNSVNPIKVLIRWPLGNFINGISNLCAIYKYYSAKIMNKTILWHKTTHRVPKFLKKI